MAMFISVTHLGLPVDEASVVIFTKNGAVVQRTITADNGRALLDANAGTTYYVKASKRDLVSITFAFTAEDSGVLDVALPDSSLVSAVAEGRCRIQGKIIDPLGNTYGWPLKISAFEGVSRSDEGVIYGDVAIEANSKGEYHFELVKNVAYVIHGLPDWGALICQVPDLAALSLQDFLFPRVTSIGNAPTELELPENAQVSYLLDIKLSNTLEGTADQLSVSSSSTSVQASIFNGYLVLVGISSGSAIISVAQIQDVDERRFGDLRGNVIHTIRVEVP